jgi:outer membrane immunogenic protein
VNGSSLDGTGGPTYRHTTDIAWLASLRTRFGVAADNWLFYATGGVALANADYSVALAGSAPFHRHSKTHVGWTLGAGIEYAVTSKLTTRIEYRYADFGSTRDVDTSVNSIEQLNLTVHAVRLGVSYRFGGP